MKLCKFFEKGDCRHGDSCSYAHVSKERAKMKQPSRSANTTDFEPLSRPVDMRIVMDLDERQMTHDMNPLDVMLTPNIFANHQKYELYNTLISEIETCGISQDKLLKYWHGNDRGVDGTHYIVDDKMDWKTKCPTFNYVVSKVCSFYNMEPKATRFNWYKDHSEWKPLHHDASKMKPHIAKKQNITVAVSFGQTRDIILQHAKYNHLYISTPSSDGQSYAFSHDVNCTWKHGVHVGDPKDDVNGRVSVIIWGWKDM